MARPELLLSLAVGAVLAGPAAASEPLRTVVTMDNGEFNMPLYTPRWNGRFKQPSVAQALAVDLSRVLGANPEVYTYLPPGRASARAGSLHRVEARRPGCTGAADEPGDPCSCGAAESCWGGIGPNYDPEASTSLFLAVSAMRETVGPGPRVEIHFADLFEEDRTTAENPADSDRCVTRAGTRKAAEALLASTTDAPLDHLAVGVLRVAVDPPPPGALWGYTYRLLQEEGTSCWHGEKGLPWESLRPPYDMAMAVVVLGVGTAGHDEQVRALLDGMERALSTDALQLELARLRAPATRATVERAVTRDEAQELAVDAAGPPSVPCREPEGRASFELDGHPVDVRSVEGACSGSARVRLAPGALDRAWGRSAGVDPRVTTGTLRGTIALVGDADPVREGWQRVASHNNAVRQRALPLLGGLEDALRLDATEGAAWAPWSHEITVERVFVSGMDQRPWGLALVLSLLAMLASAVITWLVLRRVQANRAVHAAWSNSVGPGSDPLVQRPMAVVLDEAAGAVRRQWPSRAVAALVVGVLVGTALLWVILRLHLVRLG